MSSVPPSIANDTSTSDETAGNDAGNDAGWQPTRWLHVVAPDGSVWCHTSDEEKARAHMRPGDTLYRIYERRQYQRRVVPTESTVWEGQG